MRRRTDWPIRTSPTRRRQASLLEYVSKRNRQAFRLRSCCRLIASACMSCLNSDATKQINDEGNPMLKRILLACALLTSLCHAEEASDSKPASTNVMNAEYPRVDSQGRVEVRVKAPEANSVKLNFWSGPKDAMQKQADGTWT